MEEDIYVYPSHEIHLARNTAGATEVIIQVNHKTFIATPPANSVDYLVTDVTTNTNTTIAVTAGAGGPVSEYVAASKTLKVRAGSTGTNPDTLNVSFRNTHGQTFTRAIQVFVHEKLDDWWLGNNSITVPKDSRVFHCQASIYGHFDAPSASAPGVIADITGHGFVNLSIAQTTICELDTGKRGRLKGLTVGATQLQASLAGKSINIPVNVVNFYGDPTNALDPTTIQTPNSILERVTVSTAEFKKTGDKFSYGTGAADRFNILFLAEGFTTGEKIVFDTAVNHCVQQMFGADIHQPYKMCAGIFNVWKAFTPSSESSITDRHTDAIPGQTIRGSLQSVDSFYGLYKPRRPSDVLYSRGDSFMSADPRRYPPELNWAKSIGRHIASLADSSGTKGSIWYNDLPFSATGADFLKDYGFVIIFYNVSKMYTVFTAGNANYGPFILMPLSRQSMNPASVLDRGSSTHQWKLTPAFPPVPADPKKAFGDISFTTFVFTHELTHSFDIGDEYEDPGGPYGNVVGSHSNISSFDEVRDGTHASNITSAGIKWLAFDRMQRSERILSIDSLNVQGGKIRIVVTLATTNVARWAKDKTAGVKLCLREFRVRSGPVFQGFGGLHYISKHFSRMPKYNEQMPPTTPPTVVQEPALVVIRNIDIVNLVGNNQMELDIDPAQLPASITGAANQLDALRALITANGYVNGVLYKPQRTTGSAPTDRKLVRPEVTTYIDTNHIPLDRNGSNSARGAESPPNTLVKTTGAFIGNKFPFKVIGLYEGGDHANTNAFRPTGDCRMRNSYDSSLKTSPEICHVCQYYMVSLLNPAMLEIIETKYPDF